MRFACTHASMNRLRTMRRVVAIVLSVVIGGTAGVGRSTATVGADDSTFEAASQVLLRRCVACHQTGNASGGLRLDDAEGIRRGGDSGAAIEPGDAAASWALQRIDDAEMPLPERGVPKPLEPDERRAIADWIDAGAPWPDGVRLDAFAVTTDVRGGRDWWAFAPLIDVPAPPAELSDGRNPIDGFVDQRLRDAGLSPAVEADRATLIRRLTYDLTGLPVDEIDRNRFLNDERPDAYEREVDRLLASPRFGERWGRFWLDVVRYADTSGYERDQEKPFAWRYRDWVIDAVNADIPFDRFVLEQLAGDELPDADRSTLIATGMLRLGTWNDEPNDPEEYQYERLEDLVHVTSSAFLALTVKCARCHEHKFDPIPQADYYRIGAAFWAGYVQPGPTELLGGPPSDRIGHDDLLAWTDRPGAPPPLFRLGAGDPTRPLEPVGAGFLSLLPELDTPIVDALPDERTTGRRLELARRIVDPRNPLASRVWVNRLWQGHFGYGLVRSSDNFGFLGDRPTHPELLDRLAASLGRSSPAESTSDRGLGDGTSKRLHRLIVTSAAYRRSSEHSASERAASIDADNRLLWRYDRRRLDAEGIRDSLLTLSGELDLRMGGPGFRPTLAKEVLEGLSRRDAAWSPSPPSEQRRRAVYEYTSRSLIDPLLTTFDVADTTMSCSRREQSIVAPQALALLNDPFVARLAAATVDDLFAQVGVGSDGRPSNEDALIDAAWRRAFGREPSRSERDAAAAHLVRLRSLIDDRDRRLASRGNGDTSDSTDLSAAPESDADAWPGGLSLLLLADDGLETDERGRVASWLDRSPASRRVTQSDPQRRPSIDRESGRPRVDFDGDGDHFAVDGPLVTGDEFTIVAVVTDRGSDGLREIVSNWNGGLGNAGTSIFLGLASGNAIRWTDDIPVAGLWTDRTIPAVLSASSGSEGATVHLGNRTLLERSQPLSPRRIDTAWTIGTQGNIDGEYWNGTIAALAVWDRQLADDERQAVARRLADRFGATWVDDPKPVPRSVEAQAWESLVTVLINANEFLFVD